MLLDDKIMLTEENPVLLQRAMVIDDGYFLSLTLFPPQKSAVPEVAGDQRYVGSVKLYRRPRRFFDLIFFSPRGSLQKQLVERAASLGSWLSPTKLAGYFLYRVSIVLNERVVKGMTFRIAPNFGFVWAESERSIAVLLNGEPWAFICPQARYSKGLLRSDWNGNCWNQKLFEKIFSNRS